jgi:hypothetical protein
MSAVAVATSVRDTPKTDRVHGLGIASPVLISATRKQNTKQNKTQMKHKTCFSFL